MSIRLITGLPGCGKTFLAVKHIRDTYAVYDKKLDEWKVKEGHTIITNIESLKLDHISLIDAIKSSKLPVSKFFTDEYQEKVSAKYDGIVYVIDEAQRYFDKRFYDKDTFFYFEYHRHYGHDVYLLTQNSQLLPNEIRYLAENETRGVRRSLSFLGEFKYNIMCEREIVDRKILKRDKKIFALYKSSSSDESEKPKNPLIKYLVGIVVGLIVAGLVFKATFIHSKPKKKEPEKRAVVNENVNRINEVKKMKKRKVKEVPEYQKSFMSYATIGKSLMVVDPTTGRLTSIQDFGYPVKIVIRNGQLECYARIPKSLLPKNEVDERQRIRSDSGFSGRSVGSTTR